MTDTEPTVPANPDAGRTPRRRCGWIAVLVLAVGYVLDQLTKRWVETTMTEGQVIDVLPPLLRWHFIRNPGAAFSIGEEHTWVFTVIQAAVAVFVVVLLFRVRSTAWALALGGLLGGVLGNLTDRLLRPPSFGVGHVVDFIALPNFAIFNIADSLIVCSMFGIVLLMFTGRRLDGTRETAPAPRPAAPGEDRD
ncbi:MAG: lspA [Citricoccus sp.]|nr:lspA [Citricoccus sp. WCRC_4]